MENGRRFTVELKLALLTLFFVAAACPSGLLAAARFEFKSPTHLFLDSSYVGFSPNKIKVEGDPASPARLIFEAQVAPNLFLPQLHFGDMEKGTGEYVLSVAVTPLIRLRMLNEDSSPVIPPSFMPKLTLQFLHLRPLKFEGEIRRAIAAGLNLIVGHHSNGQSGCFFTNQTGRDPACAPEGVLPLNETSGSFSTNYVRTELHGRYVFAADRELESGWLVGGGVALEVNTRGGPGGISEEQRQLYGRGRYEFEGTVQRLKTGHRARTTLTAAYPYGETPSRRATVRVEAAVMPAWAGGFGLFVRHVRGRDDYNILFLERIHLWMIGVIFELGPGINIPLPDGTGSPPVLS